MAPTTVGASRPASGTGGPSPASAIPATARLRSTTCKSFIMVIPFSPFGLFLRETQVISIQQVWLVELSVKYQYEAES